MRYYNCDIVFAEIPDETTLAINITGCPNRCAGCHSPHLQEDIGTTIDEEELRFLLDRYGSCITCICFMGGDSQPREVARLAVAARTMYPKLRTAWYSGMKCLPEKSLSEAFDYIKLGPCIEAMGPLGSPTTNQRLYKIENGTMTDITWRFQKGQDSSFRDCDQVSSDLQRTE